MINNNKIDKNVPTLAQMRRKTNTTRIRSQAIAPYPRIARNRTRGYQRVNSFIATLGSMRALKKWWQLRKICLWEEDWVFIEMLVQAVRDFIYIRIKMFLALGIYAVRNFIHCCFFLWCLPMGLKPMTFSHPGKSKPSIKLALKRIEGWYKNLWRVFWFQNI